MAKGQVAQKPKRPRNAYICFLAEQPKGDLTFSAFTKACAEKWGKLPENIKKVYKDLANADKERYLHELKGYSKQSPNLSIKKKKRSKNAYLFFAMNTRKLVKQEHPSWNLAQISRELGRRWNNMSQLEKAKYIKMAQADKRSVAKQKRTGVAYTTKNALKGKAKASIHMLHSGQHSSEDGDSDNYPLNDIAGFRVHENNSFFTYDADEVNSLTDSSES